MCYDPLASQKTTEAEERKFNREYEEEQERMREEENERELKEIADDMETHEHKLDVGFCLKPNEQIKYKLSDELMIKEAQYRIIETIVGLENECTLKPSTVMIYKDAVTAGWVCKIGMEVRT